MSELTEAAIKKLKVNELKAELSKRGLGVKGKKDELVRRLLEAIAEDDGSDDGEDEPMEADDQDSEVGSSQEEETESSVTSSQESEAVIEPVQPEAVIEPVVEHDSEDEPEEDEPEEVAAEESPAEESPAEEEEPEITDAPETTAPISEEEPEQEDVAASEETAPDPEVEESGDVLMESETNVVTESKVTPDSSSVDTTEGTIQADDYVIVKKPSDDVTAEVENAAKAQDAIVEEQEQEVTEGKGEVSESTKEVKSPKKSPKKEDASSEKGSDVSTKEAKVKESPRKSSHSEKDSKEKSSEEAAKNGDKEKEKEEKKEKKKEPEIPDVMAEVEDEEGEVPEEFEVPEGQVILDPYLSDINFIISGNGMVGHNLVKNGFAYMWAGARANKGAKGGKVGYELKVTKVLKVDIPDTDTPVNAVRIGWSSEYSNLQLGESSLSYGFESTGKVCASSSFFGYGEKFSEGDVIGTYLDLESEPKTLRYTKNGEDLGVAMSLTVNLEEKPLFPHVFLRNIQVELNFGGNDEPWFPTLEGYSLIQKAIGENIANRTSEPPANLADCEVYLMVGLPSSGKTAWARKYSETHPKKHFNLIGVKYVLERCKLEGKHRKKSDQNYEKLMKAIITILTKMYQLCPKRKRNYIFDQGNVYKIAQEKKMALFTEFQRKAVVVVPTHDNLRRQTSECKRRGDCMIEIPFGDLCDMKCEFHLPEVGDLFAEVLYPELDEKNSVKTIRDYKSDGSRAKRTGRDEYNPGGKRKRYEERSNFVSTAKSHNRFSGGRDTSRRDEGWKNSGSGYGSNNKGRSSYGGSSYGGNSYGGGYGGSSGGYKPQNKPYSDPHRRTSSGSSGGYRQQQSYGGNSGYRGGSNYSGSSGGSYGGYNQSNNRGNTGGWSNNQNSQSQQQWGSSNNWGGYNNYGSGGGYSY